VDLTTLHPFVGLHHPVQRRRREKKLLKLEEVNERFPVMTYKAWRAQRERAGLSAEGGIATQTTTPVIGGDSDLTAPDSPPSSTVAVLDHPISDPPISADEHPPAVSETFEIESEKSPAAVSVTPLPEPPVIPSSSKHRDSTLSVDPDAEDEDDNSPIPDELLATSGDNCAICIELLEDDDEVRGLTCGHCYHQTCIDPWLTQRRASCPLCKADYYIPKPPPENPEGNNPATNTGDRTPQPVTTEHWAPLFLRPFRPVVLPTTTHTYGPHSPGPSYPPPFSRFNLRETTPPENPPVATTPETAPEATSPSIWPFRRARNPFRRRPETGNGNANALERGEAQS
jgi:Ring finger domain